jgi:DNA-binding NarL/FixJ family response regulator
MIRILIADDHALMREGLKQLFALEANLAVVGEASSGTEVFEALRRTPVDLLLLDMSMSGISGANLIQHIRSQDGSPPILVLTMHSEIHVVRYALKAGAEGYLTKDCHPKTLLGAIRKVATGGRFMDPSIAERMAFESDASSERQPHELLSEREYSIFGLLVHGRSVNEIADTYLISNKTVSTHKARLMQKLNCSTNADLFRYAAARRLVD